MWMKSPVDQALVCSESRPTALEVTVITVFDINTHNNTMTKPKLKQPLVIDQFVKNKVNYDHKKAGLASTESAARASKRN